MNGKRKVALIWFIFIFSAIVLIVNFSFLEFWFADRDPGYQNGFHIFNTQYSIIYWTTKISYLSCLLVVIWSLFEVIGLYNQKYKPSFSFRYVTTFWIVATMIGESFVLPSAMVPRIESMWNAIFNDGNWLGSYGFVFSFLDFFQFVSIHITIPILVLIYTFSYRDVKLNENENKKIFIIMNAFVFSWIIWTYITTALGEMAPYPIIDSTPNWGKFDKNGITLLYQALFLPMAIIGVNLLTFLILWLTGKQWGK